MTSSPQIMSCVDGVVDRSSVERCSAHDGWLALEPISSVVCPCVFGFFIGCSDDGSDFLFANGNGVGAGYDFAASCSTGPDRRDRFN